MSSKSTSQSRFQLRGQRTTRLDTFLDAAFAFATSMLVISVGDIPRDYASLVSALKGTPAFAASFACVLSFWLGHRKWRRAFGMEDNQSMILSLGLVFVLLVYVYPLRLVFGALFAWVTNGWIPLTFEIETVRQLTPLFTYYGVGFAVLAGMMSLLFLKGLRAELTPQLDEVERTLTRKEIASWGILAATALFSALWAAVMPHWLGVWAGFAYMTLPISMPICATYYERRVERLGGPKKNGD